MALLVRTSCCSSCFTRPNSGHASRPAGQFCGRPLFSRKLASPLFKTDNSASSFRASSAELFKMYRLFPNQLLGLKMNGVHAVKSGGSGETFNSWPYQDRIMEHLSALQGHFQLRFLEIALVVTNTLIWTTPLKALAETCEADNSPFNMPLLLFVALIGATVGGLLARQRKEELQRVNEQLRQINAALRRQAKIESYAPSLSYALVGARISENEVIVDPRKQELISHLKTGKNYLRNQDPEKAYVEFKAALELAQNLKDPIEEKKAARGLGASLQRQGKFREAIKYHSLVLSISERVGEDSGNTEAYGAIADCYTELGDLERAGHFYDKYIARLED